MALGSSAWFFTTSSSVARVDLVDGNAVWTGPADIGDVFPALMCIGVYRDRFPNFGDLHIGSIMAVQQTAANEAVFNVGIRLFRDGIQNDINRIVRLDLATGQVLEYPATFGSSFKGEGWREYRIWDKSAWKILNTITHQFIVEHNWADAVFTLPNGQSIGLPADGTTMGVDRGKLTSRRRTLRGHIGCSTWTTSPPTARSRERTPTSRPRPASIRCSRWSPIPIRGGHGGPRRLSTAGC
jgi:hypothetical protein